MRDAYPMKFAHGTVLQLRYTFKSLRWIEKNMGDGHFFSDSFRAMGTDYLVAGIAAGIQHTAPDVTMAKVEPIIEKHLEAGGNIPDLLDQLVSALKQAGILRRAEGEEQPAAERPTQDVESPAQ